jgi:hypothetical protein
MRNDDEFGAQRFNDTQELDSASTHVHMIEPFDQLCLGCLGN